MIINSKKSQWKRFFNKKYSKGLKKAKPVKKLNRLAKANKDWEKAYFSKMEALRKKYDK